MAADEKTEKATPKKRRDQRKKGNVFKSQDIIVITSLLGSFLAIKYMFPYIFQSGRDFLTECIDSIHYMNDISAEQAGYVMRRLAIHAGIASFPMLMTAVVIAIISTGIQTKWLFTWSAAAPKLSRVNPLQGIKKLFSLKSVVNLIKNLIKITLLLVILYNCLKKSLPGMIRTMDMSIEDSVVYMAKTIMDMIKQVVMWFVAIAAADFMYERWDYERQLKMTKEEVKEEYKQMEGNPEIKSRIKGVQRKMARSRMMQAVPNADVVIRNPTHYAVALKYDYEKDNAPVLLAKGQDLVALRIVKIAEENHIHIVENKPLARAVYATTELNQEIPPELYGMVAELLVYIYKLRNKEG